MEPETGSETRPGNRKDTLVGVGAILLFAVIIVVTIVILYVMYGRITDRVTDCECDESSAPGTQGTSNSVVRAPDSASYLTELTSRAWNALVTTYKVPGIVTDYTQVSGRAVFNQQPGNTLQMDITWLTGSFDYMFGNWRLNSTMDSYTVSYIDVRTGARLEATIERRTSSRYDITIYDDKNNIKRLIIVT